jgi:hypothetical protein
MDCYNDGFIMMPPIIWADFFGDLFLKLIFIATLTFDSYENGNSEHSMHELLLSDLLNFVVISWIIKRDRVEWVIEVEFLIWWVQGEEILWILINFHEN